MISPRELGRRDARIAKLQAKPAIRLTATEHDELRRLEALRDTRWRMLPRQIATARHRLQRLVDEANAIGLGPC